ncbi:MAG: pantoate--beta-alanine ligase [Marinilabiliales bacterium]|nr:MAG: pantoate--beta-alanine ligase [Marinilabiliales bacterium]
MKIFSKISETTSFIKQLKDVGKTVGFVPTMGALHQGHLQLMRRAKLENDILVVSIFVNPIQFNNKSDLETYPRVFEKDIKLLEEVNADILFSPSEQEMYPEPVNKEYDFGALGNVMEGANRPGHFNGVAIVVSKLFDICIPHKAYFGEKDFQQLAIINKLVKIENTNVEIVPCEIVREHDGLAMSSRNARLSENQRQLAPFIYETLKKAQNFAGDKSVEQLKNWVKNQFIDKKEFDLEYFEICDSIDLQPINHWNQAETAMGFIVVHMGNVRLIDNIRLFNNFASSNIGNK